MTAANILPLKCVQNFVEEYDVESVLTNSQKFNFDHFRLWYFAHLTRDEQFAVMNLIFCKDDFSKSLVVKKTKIPNDDSPQRLNNNHDDNELEFWQETTKRRQTIAPLSTKKKRCFFRTIEKFDPKCVVRLSHVYSFLNQNAWLNSGPWWISEMCRLDGKRDVSKPGEEVVTVEFTSNCSDLCSDAAPGNATDDESECSCQDTVLALRLFKILVDKKIFIREFFGENYCAKNNFSFACIFENFSRMYRFHDNGNEKINCDDFYETKIVRPEFDTYDGGDLYGFLRCQVLDSRIRHVVAPRYDGFVFYLRRKADAWNFLSRYGVPLKFSASLEKKLNEKLFSLKMMAARLDVEFHAQFVFCESFDKLILTDVLYMRENVRKSRRKLQVSKKTASKYGRNLSHYSYRDRLIFVRLLHELGCDGFDLVDARNVITESQQHASEGGSVLCENGFDFLLWKENFVLEWIAGVYVNNYRVPFDGIVLNNRQIIHLDLHVFKFKIGDDNFPHRNDDTYAFHVNKPDTIRLFFEKAEMLKNLRLDYSNDLGLMCEKRMSVGADGKFHPNNRCLLPLCCLASSRCSSSAAASFTMSDCECKIVLFEKGRFRLIDFLDVENAADEVANAGKMENLEKIRQEIFVYGYNIFIEKKMYKYNVCKIYYDNKNNVTDYEILPNKTLAECFETMDDNGSESENATQFHINLAN